MLVLLPCEMPWWAAVIAQLVEIESNATSLDSIIECMRKIHDLCNIGLDPDELDKKIDSGSTFNGLKDYLEKIVHAEEKEHFVNKTIRVIARLAKKMKIVKPPDGINFLLQQEPKSLELEYGFVASLLANAFFSTFPKRTHKTHPTLQNFNFSYLFNSLTKSAIQRSKFKCILEYFDWIDAKLEEKDTEKQLKNKLKISRKVMSGKQWLTIEDWQECTVPLCSIFIRHDQQIESSSTDTLQTVFVSPRVGGAVLLDQNSDSQETVQFSTCPELLATLLFVEHLTDNESLIVENCHQVARIVGPKDRAVFERLDQPRLISMGCMDAEQYSELIVDQFEEDNFLRELNKCLLTFRQNLSFSTVQDLFKDRRAKKIHPESLINSKRLSPIGESGSTTPMHDIQFLLKQASSATPKSVETQLRQDSDLIRNKKTWFTLNNNQRGGDLVQGPTALGRKGRFIILGSSGECLPVKRSSWTENRDNSLSQSESNDQYSSCESSEEDFHSAKESFDEEDDEDYSKKYSNELDTPEKRFIFAQRLREALNESSSCFTDSTDESSAADGDPATISVSGSQVHNERIRIRRRNSGGFVLREDSSMDDEEMQDLVRNRSICDENGRDRERNSSKYSFSTDFSSEVSEICDNLSSDVLLSKVTDKTKDLVVDPRDKAVFHFAASILKRTLSESLVGVPLPLLADDDNNIINFTNGSGPKRDSNNNTENQSKQTDQNASITQFINARSFSVEMVKHKYRIAAKLISQILQHRTDIGGNLLMPVATGNWGCGKGKGDVQLKFFIQWMAASLAGLPFLIYHTARNEKLSKLDTVCRILRDRKWSVGRLARMTVKCINYFLENPAQFLIEGTDDRDLFDRILGFDKNQ